MTDPIDPRPPPVVAYWAISILNSRTFWFNAANAILSLLSMSEIVTLIPARFLPLQLAIVAVVNLYLRTVTTRPVAFIAQGTTAPVLVAKLGPPPAPAPPTIGD